MGLFPLAGPHAAMSAQKGLTVKDVDPHSLVTAYASLLKKQGKLDVPRWVDIVKTGTHKELSPYNQDWFYIRCASIARHIYIRGGVGVGGLRKVYGGSKRRGSRPSRHQDGSGSVARKAVQALEKIKVLEKCPDGG